MNEMNDSCIEREWTNVYAEQAITESPNNSHRGETLNYIDILQSFDSFIVCLFVRSFRFVWDSFRWRICSFWCFRVLAHGKSSTDFDWIYGRWFSVFSVHCSRIWWLYEWVRVCCRLVATAKLLVGYWLCRRHSPLLSFVIVIPVADNIHTHTPNGSTITSSRSLHFVRGVHCDRFGARTALPNSMELFSLKFFLLCLVYFVLVNILPKLIDQASTVIFVWFLIKAST